MRSLALLALVLTVTACTRGDDDRVTQYATAALGKPAAALRISARTDLTGDVDEFYLVTQEDGPSLVVVVPRTGGIFDSHTKDAFDRVVRAEHATERLSQIGAERVAAWFGALGGGACPPPPVDQAHFAEVTRGPDKSVQLSYPAGFERTKGVEKSCVIELGPDGALRSARTLETSAPRAASTWSKESRE